MHKHSPKHPHKHNPRDKPTSPSLLVSVRLPNPPRRANRRLGRDYGPYVDYNRIEGMKFVESLRGKYPNSNFWIIGTDPNLDLYPDNFFDDKLSITLNFACIGFPNSTYFCSSHTTVAEGIVHKLGSDYLSKCIFIALYQDYRDPIKNIWWEDYGLNPVYAKVVNKHYRTIDNEDRERMMEQISNEGQFELVGGFGVVSHAMQIATLFGAKKIILVGCSNKGGKVYYHAQKRGMSEFYKDQEMNPDRLESFRTGRIINLMNKKREMKLIIRLLEKYNLEIVKHRFDEEKNEFIFEEIKLNE